MFEAIEIETEENELHFATKDIKINDMKSMLEAQGWTLNN